MKSIILASSFIALLLLSSCESKYASKQGEEGYITEIQLDANTYRISYDGNHPERVDRYALFRSAELTIEKGYDHFVIISDSHYGDSRVGSVAIKTIRMFKGLPPQSDLVAYDAKAMVAEMTPFITRDTTK